MGADYHLWLEEQAKGPFTIGQLRTMWNSGQVTSETHYTIDAGESWDALSEIISELEPTIQKESPIAILPVQALPVPKSKKGVKILLLFLFLGVAGIIAFCVIFSLAQNAQQTNADAINQSIASLQDLAEKKNQEAMVSHMVRIGMSAQDVLRSLGNLHGLSTLRELTLILKEFGITTRING
jgi:hypothetical protein